MVSNRSISKELEMTDNVVLGVHSWVDPNTQAKGNSFDRFTDGHAWLTVSSNGEVSYYGLWPDSHPDIVRRGQNDPEATDIREGREAGSEATASRYYNLTPEQAKELETALKQNVTWSPTTTCAGWASDTVTSVTGNKLDATEFLSIETPRQLVKTIRTLEDKQPTAADQALPAAEKAPKTGVRVHFHSDFCSLGRRMLAGPQRRPNWASMTAQKRSLP